jgi:hypothetical protein
MRHGTISDAPSLDHRSRRLPSLTHAWKQSAYPDQAASALSRRLSSRAAHSAGAKPDPAVNPSLWSACPVTGCWVRKPRPWSGKQYWCCLVQEPVRSGGWYGCGWNRMPHRRYASPTPATLILPSSAKRRVSSVTYSPRLEVGSYGVGR